MKDKKILYFRQGVVIREEDIMEIEFFIIHYNQIMAIFLKYLEKKFHQFLFYQNLIILKTMTIIFKIIFYVHKVLLIVIK